MYLCLNEFEVRGILDGTITELWRPVKPQPQFAQIYDWNGKRIYEGEERLWFWKNRDWEYDFQMINDLIKESPFGPVGTRITGKEVWATNGWFDGKKQCVYKADVDECGRIVNENLDESDIKWRSPICLPAELSRLTLINTGVECKPVREITEEEAKAAGITPSITLPELIYRAGFMTYWDSLHAQKGYPFETAWAWKLKFEVELKKRGCLNDGRRMDQNI